MADALATYHQFPDDYQLEVFFTWYNTGKPNNKQLLELLSPDPASGLKPSERTLKEWINNRFTIRALELDDKVAERIEQELVAQRVGMLERHAELGMKMQTMGIEYLEEHGVGSARNAITLLVRGVEIEHEARIAPIDILSKLDKMTDEQLIEDLKKYTSGMVIDSNPVDTDARNPESEDDAL